MVNFRNVDSQIFVALLPRFTLNDYISLMTLASKVDFSIMNQPLRREKQASKIRIPILLNCYMSLIELAPLWS